MTIQGLLGRLHAAEISLRRSDGDLLISGKKENVDASLLQGLRIHKAALLDMMGDAAEGWWRPPVFGPESFPLAELDQDELDRIVARVPGGASNIQDIYPLAPLQEGILFHHLMGGEGDPYLLEGLLRFESRERLDEYLVALRAVIARHDILRTSIVWEGVREPVQVVWREAPLKVEEVELDPADDAETQMYARFDPRHYRIDLGEAPLMRGHIARDAGRGSWLLSLLRHHMVSDHTTQALLRSEVRAFLSGRAGELPEPLPFRNYVAQARLGVSRAEHQAFFGELLGDVDEPTAPFGLLDVWGDGSGLEEVQVALDDALAVRIWTRARGLGVSAASLCHVAWARVVARVSGRDDVVFGTVLVGRSLGSEGADRGMGMFINTLPVRIGAGEVSVEAAVRRAHALLAELLRHEHASLALAQRCSGVQAPAPLFTSLLNYRHIARQVRTPLNRVAARGISRVHSEERTNYPVVLSVEDHGDRLRLTAQVQASIGAARVCGLMRAALEGLVEALETAPSTAVGSIDVLPAEERARLLGDWSRADVHIPADVCVHELFEAQARRTPDAVAVSFEDRALGFGELNRRANRLAHHLRTLGVGPDTRVGVCVEPGVEMMVAVLGVLKAGGAYVPLDPAYPEERLRHALDDSAPAVLLTQGSLAARFAGIAAPVLALDAAEPAWGAAPDAELPRVGVGVTPGHVCYVIYTSGSTGRPKGVRVEHRGLVATAAAVIETFGFGAADRVPSISSFAFDIWLFESFFPLLAGGSVRMIARERVLDVPRLVAEELAGCTVLHAVPALMRRIVQEVRSTPAGALPGVRRVMVGGDAVAPDLVDSLREVFPAAEVRVGYGPTEAAIVCAAHPVRPEPASRQMVGRPLGNAALYVLDAAGEPAPVGVPGELFLGGAAVARDYLGRPGLTAERFVPDPFGEAPGARLYRTGDRVRWLGWGEIEFLGRTDNQVKIRGFRIEPGEVEGRLLEHPGVRDAVVLAREDVPGEKRLVAYWVPAAEAGVDGAKTLREHLSRVLPEYMVPAAYVELEALPLSPNGKVDRRALPAPDGDAYARQGYEAPLGETETALAAIWAAVLGVERVGRWDQFFELGGHSLLAVQVVSRVRQALEVELTLGDLFARPVLADFARGLRGAAAAALPPIEPAARGAQVPLSFAQARLWFLAQLGGAGRAYHIPSRQRLRGELDRDALRRALDRILARHEALRTTFHEVDGTPEQRIAPAEACAFQLVEHDLSGSADRQAELRRLMEAEAAAPFDLARGPLVRGRLVRMAEDDHVLLLTLHHIVSDGWSMGVLTGELDALYGAFRRGEADPLPPLPVQYADYAAWQRRWVSGEVLRAQADYWTRTLAGAPAVLALPADRPRPAEQDHAGAAVGVEFDAALTAGLKALGRRHGTTPFMTLLAAWAAVLGRLSGQDDVVVGTPVANRGRPEIEGLIGFFVGTLALRVDLAGAPTVAELLARVKARALETQHHQDIPFEQVVELVQPARSLSHTPLFQVMLAWQSTPEAEVALPGLEHARAGGPASVTAKFDLSLVLSERGGRIAGGVAYATALYDRATVERHVAYLRRAVEAMVADEGQRVDRLPILPAEERARVVEEWNAAEAELPGESRLHALFEAQAARTPDAVALSFDGRALTYAALNADANRLAHHLRTLGVGPDARVAICVERGMEMVVGLLGVLKAGGAYVPLDPAYPEERLRYVLDDSAPVAVLTQRSLHGTMRGLLAGSDVPVLDLDSSADWADRPTSNPEIEELAPGHLAYVIHTSGSTGQPKGVGVSHRNVARLFSTTDEWFRFGERDVWTLFHSFAFDFSVWEIWGALLYGGRLVVVAKDTARSPDEFYRLLCAEGVTILNQTPSAFRQLIAAQAASAEEHRLRHVIFGGEALELATLAPWFARNDDRRTRLVNMYGITETTVHVTYRPLVAADAERVGASPIGRRIPDLRTYVLDGAGEPVPIGVAGEMYVGGGGVARGYLNRPELTAQRFVPDPFSTLPGARLYRTGDLGRWLADGTIEYLGRNDQQVKVRGFRIELGEIEARLCGHPAVREAVVMAREDVPGDQRLVAYWVGGEETDAEALRTHLSGILPDHMLPAAYVRLDALPLTTNGKVDRRALPSPDEMAFPRRGYEAPADETETALAEIWADVLRVERVGRRDHFFDLGGHSLLAVKVISRVRQVLGSEVALGDLFLRPVLADFARGIAQAGGAALPPIEPVDRGGRLALSFAQQRLWFLDRLGGAGAAYHVPLRRRMRGALDREALARALDAVVARHEALRTTFRVMDGEAVQWIAPPDAGFRLVEHDLSTEPDREVRLRRLMAEEAGAPFDLAQGPLIRGRLVRMEPDDHVLLVTMHHIVSDAWSMGVLFGELGVLYAAFGRGEPDPLPALPLHYADYAAWQRRWVEGEVLQRQQDYWTRTLAGAPERLELPADRPRPAEQDHAGASVALELDEATTEGLKALGRRRGTTPFMTLLAAWAVVLSRLSGQDDVVVGTPTANRGRREIEGLIGFFVNTLALRFDLAGAPTVAELLERVKARTLEAQHHQDIPFEQVVERVQPARSLSHTPLFQVMFAWQPAAEGGGLALPGLSLEPLGGAAQSTVKFDLSLGLSERGGRIGGAVSYATALFDRSTIERHVGYLRRVVEAMAMDETARVDRIVLLADEERARVVDEWNATDAAFPADAGVHALFEAQAARTPNALAIVHGDRSLTYAELDERANRVARALVRRGVTPGARVALLLPRSLELAVAELAVLKAGAAYVPLDPAYPEERLRLILEDAGISAVLACADLQLQLSREVSVLR
ncbi:MAG TPA: amino acid adenylation domain-containing protein, partial [Longimicrobium sp.]|nr:amino acid adenylation domain-containing protein [Longimicrobium sp.]